VQPFPGARDLIERLHADGYRLCVATSSKEDEMRPALERLGIGDLIEAHAFKSDADRSKPAPDLVRASLDHLGVDAPAALMLGDTPYDIEAAARAGVRTVAFRCGGFPDASLGGALAIFDGPRDLLRRYDHSPFSRRSQRGAA
jgi:HAD superfamily hydrolase (TIGR01509 family)